MVTELIRPVSYNPGSSQKIIKLEKSSCRCSQLECNEENDEIEGYSALYTPLLPLISVSGIPFSDLHQKDQIPHQQYLHLWLVYQQVCYNLPALLVGL